MNEQAITLDVSKAVNPTQWVYMGQGDRGGTTIVASIYDNGEPLSLDDKTAQFEMLLPGGKHYVMDHECEVSGNTVTYVVDESRCCQVTGKTTVAYFDIMVGTSIIASTERFSIQILEGAHEDGTAARSYLGIVDELVTRLGEASEEYDAAEAARAEEYAEIRDDFTTAATAASNAANSANSAASEATSAASQATSAASSANSAASSAGSAATQATSAASSANSAATDANSAAARANEAAAAAEGAAAMTIPTMSASVKGGATLGQGLEISGDALSVTSLTSAEIAAAVADAL